MHFSPQILKPDCGPGFPMQTAMSNFNRLVLTFHKRRKASTFAHRYNFTPGLPCGYENCGSDVKNTMTALWNLVEV